MTNESVGDVIKHRSLAVGKMDAIIYIILAGYLVVVMLVGELALHGVCFSSWCLRTLRNALSLLLGEDNDIFVG